MKVNFKKELAGPDGKPVGMMDEQLRNVLFQADSSEGSAVSADEKYKLYRIGKSLLENNGEIDMSVEEAALLKRICSVCFRAGAYGQVIDIIEA